MKRSNWIWSGVTTAICAAIAVGRTAGFGCGSPPRSSTVPATTVDVAAQPRADLPMPLPAEPASSAASFERPSKLTVAEHILGEVPEGMTAATLFIHLDARRAGVRVPEKHKGDPQLVLQVGRHMAIPIPDLQIDASGVHATLSFQDKPFHCDVPWAAVFALVGEDGRGMIYPDDTPPEVQAMMKSDGGTPAP
jgi:hypothetical protein